MPIDPRLAKLGFVSAARPAGAKRRLFITSEGPTAAGKTEFFKHMRPPIVVIDFDRGMEGVAEYDIWGNEIAKFPVEMPDLDEFSKSASVGERELAKNSYARFKKIVRDTLKSDIAGTLVVDTGTAAYNLAQIARFGQIAQVGEVPAGMWTSMQAEFEGIFLEYERHGCNLYVTHRQGNKFKGLTGETEMKGYKQMQYLSQVHLAFDKRERIVGGKRAGFDLVRRIVKCRQRIALEGAEFGVFFTDDTKMNSMGGDFLEIATAVFPNTTEADWI